MDLARVGVDGFDFNPNVVNQAGRWPWLAVSRLRQVIADPTVWRPRIYPVPLQGGTVAAQSDFLEQLFIRPGSVLYGLSFASLDGQPSSDLLFQVSFDYESKTLFSKPQLASAYQPAGAVRPVLLSEPKYLAGSAVSVRVYNTASVARAYQLLLCCAEPWGVDGNQ